MTNTTLCKKTINALIEALKEDFDKVNTNLNVAPGDWDRGHKAGIGYAIWKLTRLQND